MKRKMKKTLKLAAAVSLVSTMMLAAPAYADTLDGGTGSNSSSSSTSAAMRLSFPDVPSSHWAIKHVTRLAVEGVVQGDDLGRYNPESSVSQQDVIIMAIRMMGLENAALQSKSSVALPFNDVRADARPYVAYALDQNLINLQEEVSSSNSKWGTKEAPREWVAKIVIRAINKTQSALSKAGMNTGFADNQKISSGSVGFVNEALALGIVQGFEDNTFRPEGSVTRAQMATFWSRAEKYLANPSSRIVSGTIMAIDGTKLSIRESNGRTRDVQVSPSASFYTNKNDTTRLTLSDFKLYHEVYVLQNLNTAYFVEMINDEVPMKSYEGTLVSVNISDLTASIQMDGKFYTYDLASNVSVLDVNGAGLSLGSLVENTIIEFKKHALIADAKISQIVVKKVPLNKTVNGAFESVDLAALTVSVKDKDTGLLETYPLTDGTTFVQADKPFDPASLFPGDTVRVIVKNDKVASVVVVQQVVEKRDSGKLLSISEDKSIVTVQKADEQYAAYKVSDKLLVVLGDNQYGSIRDLMPGDEMKIEINQNKIDKITVVGRTIESLTLATIEQYSPDTKFLIVTDELGKPKIYKVSDTTSLLYNENSIPLESFKGYLVKGKRVNIVASQDKLISVQFATKMEGTIVSVSATSGDVTIKTASGVSQTYKTMSNVYVNKYSQAIGKLSDLRAGDFVRGFFDGNQENVVSLSVRESQLVHVKSIDTALNSITVVDSVGATKSYGLFAMPVHRNGAAVGINSIQVDEPLEMTFIGTELTSVQVVDGLRGKISSVDAAAGKITLTDYTNNTHVIETGGKVTVKSGNSVLPSIAVLNPEDRVEIVKNESGHVTVLILTAQQRVVHSYNSTTMELTFMRATTTENATFPLHAKAYVHQGAQVIAPASLVAGETVTVYFLYDKIVEIAKP